MAVGEERAGAGALVHERIFTRCTAARNEQQQLTGEDVLVPFVSDDGRQAIDAVAHVDGRGGQQDAHAARQQKHASARTFSTSPRAQVSVPTMKRTVTLRASSSSIHPRPVVGARRAKLDLHPVDATRLGVVAGDRVRVVSRRGSVEVHVGLDSGLKPGLTFMTLHFPDDVDVNQLTIDATDPKSGTAEFKAAAVRLEKL